MTLPDSLLAMIEQGKCQTVEFKKSTTDITKDVYETVCSFSNREGGDIFLGVVNGGTILGVRPDRIDKMKKDFVNSINNPSKMYPPLYLTPIEYTVDGRSILYIHVPPSSNVCRCNGRIYDRNHESDIDITDNQGSVYHLYARKQDTYYTNKVFPVFSVADLRHDLLDRARKMTRTRIEHHPWLDMTDEQLLRSAGLILTDTASAQEGITLAAILLFGTDSMILSTLAHHKTDAIFRVFNVDRYDDRDVIITNLLESYDRLMAFGERHLNDLFTMDGIISVSARDKILREIVSNSLMHRDFSSAYVAKLIVEGDRILTENSNRSHGVGALDLSTFEPVPKNPPISKVFREIGLADELGSGMRNTYKFTRLYSNAEPRFLEGDIFRTIIPLTQAATAKAGPNVPVPVSRYTDTEALLGTHVGSANTQVGSASTQVGSTSTQVGPAGAQVGPAGAQVGPAGAQVGPAGAQVEPAGAQVEPAGAQVKLPTADLEALLDFCSTPKSRKEMQEFCGVKRTEYFRKRIIRPLLEQGKIKRTIPDKPNSRNQKYVVFYEETPPNS